MNFSLEKYLLINSVNVFDHFKWIIVARPSAISLFYCYLHKLVFDVSENFLCNTIKSFFMLRMKFRVNKHTSRDLVNIATSNHLSDLLPIWSISPLFLNSLLFRANWVKTWSTQEGNSTRRIYKRIRAEREIFIDCEFNDLDRKNGAEKRKINWITIERSRAI